ncbi:MAG: hypothetical protein ACOC56_04725 [Atribacterota bacterium]
MIDWKRNNKIALRNFNKKCDFHDIVKTLLVRMLRRKHKDNYKTPIYTEYSPNKPNEEYPDIWMRVYEGKGKSRKAKIIVWELQDKITKDWKNNILKRYEEVDLIIVPLKDLEKKSEGNLFKLQKLLEDYIV